MLGFSRADLAQGTQLEHARRSWFSAGEI